MVPEDPICSDRETAKVRVDERGTLYFASLGGVPVLTDRDVGSKGCEVLGSTGLELGTGRRGVTVDARRVPVTDTPHPLTCRVEGTGGNSAATEVDRLVECKVSKWGPTGALIRA